MPIHTPVLIAGAAGAALLGYLGFNLLQGRSGAAKAAYELGQSDGFSQGVKDANAGLPESLGGDDPTVQLAAEKTGHTKDYLAGYQAGYEKGYSSVSPTSTPSSSPTTTFPSGGGGSSKPYESPMKPGESAFDYGCRRGQVSGTRDAEDGYESSWEFNLTTPTNKARQAESGNPVEFQKGYRNCYIPAYAAVATLEDWKDIKDSYSDDGGEMISSAGINDQLFFVFESIDSGKMNIAQALSYAEALERAGRHQWASAVRDLIAKRSNIRTTALKMPQFARMV